MLISIPSSLLALGLAALVCLGGWVVILQRTLQTERSKRAEKETSDERLRTILDASPVVLFVWEAREGWPVQFVSNNIELFGYTTEQMYSGEFTFADLIHPDDLERVTGEVARHSHEHVDDFIQEYRLLTREKQVRWVYDRSIIVRDAQGHEVSYQGILLDITEKREAELQLQQSQQLYKSMFENTGTGTVLSEADTILSKVNTTFARMVGYGKEEIEAQMSWKEFITPEYQEKMDAYHHARRSDPDSAPTQWECDLVSRDGTIKPMLLKVSLIPGTTTSIGAFLDISDLKAAQNALKDSNRMLQLVLDTIPVHVFTKDLQHRYVWGNKAFGDYLGLDNLEALHGKLDEELGFTSSAVQFREYDQHVVTTGEPLLHYEEDFISIDGQHVWMITSKVPLKDEHGQITGLLGTFLDITDRKNKENEIRKLRNYLSSIINSMPSVLVGVDQEGLVTLWNRKAEQATGVGHEVAINQPLIDFFPEMTREMERIQRAIRERRVIKDPKIVRSLEFEKRFENITIYPLISNGEEGAVIRVDDVTDQVRLEEMMIQSEKMLSVGGLAAGMAHEINNPLAGIIQTAEVMSNRLMDVTGQSANARAAEQAGTSMKAIGSFMELRGIPRMLATIRDSGSRVAEVVENMLSFSRKSEDLVSSHALDELVDTTLELAATDYDLKKEYDFRKIEIKREFEDGLPLVHCERTKIQQVLLNILRNGAEAMQDNAGRHPRFIIRLYADALRKMVCVDIQDNGPGMDEKTRRRVFEPFFTTKPVGLGTGLGLSVSYFIITENHGGELEVRSRPGGGTTFTIRLPVH